MVSFLTVRPRLQLAFWVALSAALYAGAFPPLAAFPLAWIALIPLYVAATHARTVRTGFAVGLVWALLVGLATSWWLPTTIAGFFEVPALLAWVAALMAVAATGVWYGVFTAWLGHAARRGGVGPLSVGLAWAAAEYLRTVGPLANPWALSGYSQTPFSPLIQVAGIVGVVGVGGLIASANALLAARVAPGLHGRTAGSLAVCALLVASLIHGLSVLGDESRRLDQAGGASLVLVQPAESVAADRAQLWEEVRVGIEEAVAERPDLILLPELAVDSALDSASPEGRDLVRLAHRGASEILVGGLADFSGIGLARPLNGYFLFRDGSIVQRYDKVALLPFAERTLGVAGSRLGTERFVAGASRQPLLTRVGPLGVLLCSEIMLAGPAREAVAAGAALLANPANDHWLGSAGAKRMQLDIARLRAIEVRRPILRSTRGGIDAVIDSYGRVAVSRAPASTASITWARVSPSGTTSPYVVSGHAFGLLALIATLLAMLWRSRRSVWIRVAVPAAAALSFALPVVAGPAAQQTGNQQRETIERIALACRDSDPIVLCPRDASDPGYRISGNQDSVIYHDVCGPNDFVENACVPFILETATATLSVTSQEIADPNSCGSCIEVYVTVGIQIQGQSSSLSVDHLFRAGESHPQPSGCASESGNNGAAGTRIADWFPFNLRDCPFEDGAGRIDFGGMLLAGNRSHPDPIGLPADPKLVDFENELVQFALAEYGYPLGTVLPTALTDTPNASGQSLVVTPDDLQSDVEINGIRIAAWDLEIRFASVEAPTPDPAASDLALFGRYAFVADAAFGLRVFDTSHPGPPFQIGDSFGNPVNGIDVDGTYAYLTSPAGLGVVDMGLVSTPTLLGQVSTPGEASDVVVVNHRAFVASGSAGVAVVDVGDPSAPSLLGSLDTPGTALSLQMIGATGYVADCGPGAVSGLRIVDFSTPQTPVELAAVPTPGCATSVRVRGGIAFVGDDGLIMVDVRNPAQPIVLGEHPVAEPVVALELEDAILQVLSASMLTWVDISDPALPVDLELTPIQGGPERDLEVRGGVAYIAAGDQLLVRQNPLGASRGRQELVSRQLVVAERLHAVDVIDHHLVGVGDQSLVVQDLHQATRLSGSAPGVSTSLGGLDVRVVGPLAFVAAGPAGVRIVDLSDPLDPVQVTTVPATSSASKVDAAGQYAYVLDGGALRVIDVSIPAAASVVGSLPLGLASNLRVLGSHAYVTGTPGLTIVDVSEPTAPAITASLYPSDFANDVEVSGGRAFVSGLSTLSELAMVDVQDPGAPVELARVTSDVSRLDLEGTVLYGAALSRIDAYAAWDLALIGSVSSGAAEHQNLAVAGSLAIVPSMAGAASPLVRFVDMAGLSGIARRDSIELFFEFAAGAEVAGNVYYTLQEGSSSISFLEIFDGAGHFGTLDLFNGARGLKVFGSLLVVPGVLGTELYDLSDPFQPVFLSSVVPATQVEISGNLLFVGTNVLSIYDISNPASPALVGGAAWQPAISISSLEAMESFLLVGSASRLDVLSVAVPAAPVFIGARDGGPVRDIQTVGRIAFLADSVGSIIDLSTPASPSFLGSLAPGLDVTDLEVSGSRLLVASATQLQVYDISSPTSPVLGFATPRSAGFVRANDPLVVTGDGLGFSFDDFTPLPDADGDGLPSARERGSCTSSEDRDSDDDGLADGVEDRDRDGVVDPGETDPCNRDSDGDGLTDGDELGSGATFDPDGSGVLMATDPAAYENRSPWITDPLDPDTDGDGFVDGDEVAAGTDPLDPFDPTPVPAGGLLWRALLASCLALVGGRLARRSLRRRVVS